MRLVVDASVAVKWLVEEKASESADRLLQGNHELHDPGLSTVRRLPTSENPG